MLPAAMAAAWTPVRSDLPNTDVAILLVLCVGLAAMAGGRPVVLIGALTAAFGFDFFDTPPYGQLFMTRGRDVITTVVLVGASLAVGELCVRARAYRRSAASRDQDFTVISNAARMMGFGEDANLVVSALAGELASRIGVADCDFQYGPPPGDRPCVARDGTLVSLGAPVGSSAATEIDLPVWAGTDVVGCFRLQLASSSPPSADRLLAAVGIAEQAGAALATRRLSPENPPPGRSRQLRLLR